MSKALPVSFRLKRTKDWEFDYVLNKKEYSNIFFINLEIQKYFKKILFFKNLKFIKLFFNINGSTVYMYIYYTVSLFESLKIYEINLNLKKLFFLFTLKKNNKSKIHDKLKARNEFKKFFKIFFLKRLKIFLFFKYLKINFKETYKDSYKFFIFFTPLNIKNFNKKKKYFLKDTKKIKKLKNNYINKYRNKLRTGKKYKKKYKKKLSKIFYLLYLGVVYKEPYFISKIIENFLYKQKKHRKYFYYIINDLKKILKKRKNLIGFRVQLKGRLNGKMRAKKICIKQGANTLTKFNRIFYCNYLPVESRYGVFGVKTWLIYQK